MKPFPATILILVLSLLVSACDSGNQAKSPQTDTDSESDADSDADADGDSDTDADSDADSGGSIDGNSDTGVDTDSDAENITDGDSDTGTTGDTDNPPSGYLCDAGVYDGSAPAVINTGNPGTHDPTMIKEGNTYYLLATGHHIPVSTSGNMEHWSWGGSVYNNTYPAWSDTWLAAIAGEEFNFPWAPDVSYFGGRFHIYSSFSAIFGDNISCMTHLTASTMAGPWVDQGPVFCTEGNENYNAIDADVELDADGTPWLAFGSFWSGIQVIKLDLNGDRDGNEIHRVAWNSSIEAPVLFRRCGYYYLFVSFGRCCDGVNSTYEVRVGRSQNILGPYSDKDGVAMLEGGGTFMVGGDGTNFAAAGHSEVFVDDDTIYNIYHAYRADNGASVLRIAEMPFDNEGWPVPAGP